MLDLIRTALPYHTPCSVNTQTSA